MSHKINLDFANTQTFALKRLTVLGLVVFCIGLISLFYVAQHYFIQFANYQTISEKLNIPASNLHTVSKEAMVIPAEQLKEVRDTVATLTTPWGSLFNAIEQAEVPDVALLSLEPNKRSRSLLLTGQSKNMQATLRYLERLQTLPMLSNVYLQKHNVDESNPYRPVGFVIVGQWQ